MGADKDEEHVSKEIFSCGDCGETFTSGLPLNEHMNILHRRGEKKKSVAKADEREDEHVSKKRVYSCEHCDKGPFSSPQALGGHYTTHRKKMESERSQERGKNIFQSTVPQHSPGLIGSAGLAYLYGSGHESDQGDLIPIGGRDGSQVRHSQSMQLPRQKQGKQLPLSNSESLPSHGLSFGAYGPSPPRLRSAGHHAAPSVAISDAESIHNFSAYRTEAHVMKGQVWAVYDPVKDGMPRLYCQVDEVTQAPFSMEIVLLEPVIDRLADTHDWLLDRGLSIGTGDFRLSDKKILKDNTSILSHLMDIKEIKDGYEVCPFKPEVWAMYADYDKEVTNKGAGGRMKLQYGFVLIEGNFPASPTGGEGWVVATLQKLEGYKSLWAPQRKRYPLSVKDNLQKFSHRVPARTVRDVQGVPLTCLELDPACVCHPNEPINNPDPATGS